jgi:hypothetical protein
MRMLLSSFLTDPDVQFACFRFFTGELRSRRYSASSFALNLKPPLAVIVDRGFIADVPDQRQYDLNPTGCYFMMVSSCTSVSR